MKKEEKIQKKKKQTATHIAYQNKDITSKIMAEEFEGKSFAVYGVDLPRIVKVEPTNLPTIEANELRLDNLFLLEDGTYLIVDYESTYDYANMLKYLGYVVRVAKRLYNEHKKTPIIRMLVIYTADVKRGTTNPVLDTGCFRLVVTEAFLSGLDAPKIWQGVSNKVQDGEKLSSEEMMELIVYPLIFRAKRDKQRAIGDVITLAKDISDGKDRTFVLKCLTVFTDKIIRYEDAERIKEALMMTKVEQLFYEEAAIKIAKNLLRSGIDVNVIAHDTNLPLDKVLELRDDITTEKE